MKKIFSLYSYQDDLGIELFEVVRYQPKEFRVRHKDSFGKVIWKAPEKHVPYKLPGLLSTPLAEVVYVVEGEKDVDTLTSHGYAATCNRGGTGNTKLWADYGRYFQDRHVVIIPDNDDAGRKHAAEVLAYLRPFAAKVIVMQLAGLDEKGDVTDWLAMPGGSDKLFQRLSREALDHAGRVTEVITAPRTDTYEPGDAHEGDDALTEQREFYDPDWKPFPLDALPSAIAEYVAVISQGIMVDPAYVALPAIAGLAAVVGNSRVIRLTPTWTEPAVVFACLIAESGTRKSEAWMSALRPITETDFEAAIEHDRLNKEWELDNDLYTATHGNGKTSIIAGKEALRPKQPIRRRITIGDITIETIVRELANNPRGLMLVEDELTSWFSSFGRYKSGGSGGGDLAFWLKAHRAMPHIYDRKSGTQTSVLLPRAAVSSYGTIQPRIVTKVFSRDFFQSGLVARLLLAYPPRVQGEWRPRPLNEAVVCRYTKLLRDLWIIDRVKYEDWSSKPGELLMTAEAERIWADHYNRGQGEQFHAEGDMSAMLAKLEGYTARFALLFAMAEYATGECDFEEVLPHHVCNAIRVADWFRDETTRVYAMVEQDDDEYDEGRIVQKIKDAGGYYTARDLFKSNKAKFLDTESARMVLLKLCDKKVLMEVNAIPGKANPGKTKFYTPRPRD